MVAAISVVRQRIVAPGAALLLPAYLAGCFRYVPTRVEPLPGPTAEVRVRLDRPIQVPLGEITLHDVRAIEGIVAESDADTLALFAKWLYPSVGSKYDALGATFHVATGSISTLERYQFSPPRTALAAAVAGAFVVGFLYAVGLATAGASPGPPPSEEAALRGWWPRE